MQHFLPWQGLAGGLLIGSGAGLLLLAAGRIAGISSLIEGAMKPSSPAFLLNISFLAGLPLGALLVFGAAPNLVPQASLGGSGVVLVAAGLLVGFGARMGNGCTSGHGVCGLPRFSIRSMVATLTFMATAAATVFLARHAGLGG